MKAGEDDTVRYREFQNGEWGTDDENYTNRLRLAYYLLYCHIEDEEAVAFLFQDELKDRERNSFQGIGSTLQILTHLIRKYNGDGKYAGLLERAKTELQKVPQSSRYGNLYTKGIAAAKAMDDPYGKRLEKEYESFLASFRR